MNGQNTNLIKFAVKIITLAIHASTRFGHFACDAPFSSHGFINFLRWFIADDCVNGGLAILLWIILICLPCTIARIFIVRIRWAVLFLFIVLTMFGVCIVSIYIYFFFFSQPEIKLKLKYAISMNQFPTETYLNWHLPNSGQRIVDHSIRQLSPVNSHWIAPNSRERSAHQPMHLHHWLMYLHVSLRHIDDYIVVVPVTK